ncbi:MAG TPA: succinate--CoA ligase subunit beta, partial [Microthrixaceae bacterium]|nr:succinate--CoA ligase subunit beta [Microthrixaceae bacterium]
GSVQILAMASASDSATAKIWIDPVLGLTDEVARDWVAAAELNPAATEGAVDILKKLYTAYTEGDADLTEIN